MIDNKDLRVISHNILELSQRKRLISRQSELSFELLAQKIKENSNKSNNIQKSLADYKTILKDFCSEASPTECIKFISELTEGMSFPLSFLSITDEEYELFSPKASAKISYVKNNYNDLAYFNFATLFSSPKAVYGSSFEEICEDVYNGISDYCILPISNVLNGKMFGFYSLIEKYDLKIFVVSDIEGHFEKRTRYALLSRKNLVLIEAEKSCHFEFSIIADDKYSILDITEAASACNMELYRIDSIPVLYDDVSFRFYHIFKSENASLLAFWIYLNFKYSQYKTIGYYVSV